MELDLNVVDAANPVAAKAEEWREISYDKDEHEREVRSLIRGYNERISGKDSIVSSPLESLVKNAHHSLSLMAAG